MKMMMMMMINDDDNDNYKDNADENEKPVFAVGGRSRSRSPVALQHPLLVQTKVL